MEFIARLSGIFPASVKLRAPRARPARVSVVERLEHRRLNAVHALPLVFGPAGSVDDIAIALCISIPPVLPPGMFPRNPTIRLPESGQGSAGQPIATLAGSGRKHRKVSIPESNGVEAVFSLTGGTGEILEDANGVINVALQGNVALTIRGYGGIADVNLIAVLGNLRLLSTQAVDITGTVGASGSIGLAKLGDFSGALTAGGAIGMISASSLTGATILSGTDLITYSSPNTPTYHPGRIGTINVHGAIAHSFIGAGIVPVNGIFNTADDSLAGRKGLDRIIHVFAGRGADATTRFEAGVFGIVQLPKRVIPKTSSLFVTPPAK